MATNTNLKIFLVDDDIFCLTLYKQFLNKLGYTAVTSFTSGDDALENLSERPDVAFLDYSMEGLNGIDVLKKIKEFDPSILVYLISGKDNPVIAATSYSHGAVDYIVKSSINPGKIKVIMENAEERRPVAEKVVKQSFLQKLKKGLGI